MLSDKVIDVLGICLLCLNPHICLGEMRKTMKNHILDSQYPSRDLKQTSPKVLNVTAVTAFLMCVK